MNSIELVYKDYQMRSIEQTYTSQGYISYWLKKRASKARTELWRKVSGMYFITWIAVNHV